MTPKHKHDYKQTRVKRARMRGYVIITYRCENYASLCNQRVIQKRELEKP